MRSADQIRLEIDDLSARRTEAWNRLSAGDRSVRDEIARLTERMDELWVELRETSLARSYGPRDRIIAVARAHDRFDRELRRTGRPRTRSTKTGGDR
jgi:hypothetical protein